VRDARDGAVIASAAGVEEGRGLTIALRDGRLAARVEGAPG
jgi:exonuclease VII large subunit